MLSKKDLENIRTIIQEELKDALNITIDMEEFDKERGMMKPIKKDFHLPVWLAYQSPEIVGALRGMQADTGKANNRMIDTAANVKLLSDIMLQAENSLKCIAIWSDEVKQISKEEVKQIESTDM